LTQFSDTLNYSLPRRYIPLRDGHYAHLLPGYFTSSTVEFTTRGRLVTSCLDVLQA
jgi:hypothetical protein